jgi:hypothetical protein
MSTLILIASSWVETNILGLDSVRKSTKSPITSEPPIPSKFAEMIWATKPSSLFLEWSC